MNLNDRILMGQKSSDNTP